MATSQGKTGRAAFEMNIDCPATPVFRVMGTPKNRSAGAGATGKAAEVRYSTLAIGDSEQADPWLQLHNLTSQQLLQLYQACGKRLQTDGIDLESGKAAKTAGAAR